MADLPYPCLALIADGFTHDERADRVEESIRGIHRVVTSERPPPAEEKPFCASCAYPDFCWSC